MKRLVLAVLAFAMMAAPAAAQTSPSKDSKLKRLDAEIEMYQGKKKTGMILTAAGLGLSLLSYTAFPTTECETSGSWDYECEDKGSMGVFLGMVAGGSILTIIGGYKWSDASYNIRQLELKKYDLSFYPLYMPKQGNALGLALVGRF
jgi:hypothetical protein